MSNNPFESLKQLGQIGEQFKNMFNDDFMKNLMSQANVGMGTPTGNPMAPGGGTPFPTDSFWMPWNSSQTQSQSNQPKVDVFQTKQEVVILVDLPGIERAGDVKVHVEPRQVTLRGSFSNRFHNIQREQFALSERSRGDFEREIALPIRVRTDKTRALYRQGVLEIHLIKDVDRQDRPTGKQVDIDFE